MNTENPKISIVIPVYNGQNYIENSLNSVVNQSYENLEIIVIDDCSTDNTFNLVKNFQLSDSRIKLFKNNENIKLSRSRNVGIKNSTGDYLILLDSDDELNGVDVVKNLSEYLVNSPVDILVYDYSKVYNSNHISVKKLKIKSNVVYTTLEDRSIFLKQRVTSWSKVYDLKWIKDNNLFFDYNLGIYEDILYHWETVLKANSVAYYPHVCYRYLIRNGSLCRSGVTYNNFSALIYIMEKIKDIVYTNYNVSSVTRVFSKVYVKTYISFLKQLREKYFFAFAQVSALFSKDIIDSYKIQVGFINKFKAWTVLNNKPYLFMLLNLQFNKLFMLLFISNEK